ncbi:MAG: tetratricopeptide repeat protein, partial [Chloroflexi bacterium]|nr:tetratricopeptide repeat protein [Chloroflexota bacterium]
MNPRFSSLLPGKLRPPLLARRGVLPRQRLVRRLEDSLTRPLTLLIAPAGYGKTTLLHGWLLDSNVALLSGREKTPLEPGRAAAAWLTLDEDDGDPVHFLAYLAAALAPAIPEYSERAFDLLADAQPELRAGLSLLLHGLERLDFPLILILDDVHAPPRDADALNLLNTLLQHSPPSLHLLLAGRREPAIASISRLRAAGLVAEIDEKALRFTPSEAEALFEALFDQPLAPDVARRLVAHTEGWVTALQLAYQSGAWREVGAERTGPVALGGATSELFDYLMRVVMQGLPEADRVFLRRSAILESLQPALCDALLARTDSAAMLTRLARRGLFTFVVDAERSIYRYHSLFRAFLQRRLLEIEGRNAVRSLHRRAAAWYLEAGEDELAVHHLLEAQDWPAAADVIRSLWRPLFTAGRFGRLERWLSRFPPTFKETQPWLLLIRGRLEVARGNRRHAEQLYRQAEPLLLEAEDIDGLFALYHNLAALTASRHGDFSGAEALMRRALEYARNSEDRAYAMGYIARYRYMSQGDAEEVQALLRQAIELAEQADHPLLLANLLQLQGIIQSSRGLLLESLASFHQVLRILEHEGNRHRQPYPLQNALYAHYLLGQFDEAWALLPRARRLAEDFGRQDHLAYLLNLKGLLHQERAEWDEARACHEQALALQQGLGETYEIPVTLNFLGLLYRRQGLLNEALRYGEMGLEKREEMGNAYEIGLSLIDVGATYLALNDLPRTGAFWRRALAIFEDYDARYELTQLHFYLALLARREGDDAAMAAHLQQAMSRAREYEHGRPPRCLHFFVAERDFTAELMAAALQHELTPDCVDCLLPRLGEAGREALAPLLQASRAGVRARAATLLGESGDPAAIKPLAALRQDDDPAVRDAVTAALNALLAQPPPPLHVQCLGGFRLRRGRQSITRWERSAARVVFLLLLLRRGRPVAMEWLMETLWPEHSPRKARKNLHQAVASLRRTLEPELAPGLPSRYLSVENETYRLRLPPDSSVDFEQFERKMTELLAESQADA